MRRPSTVLLVALLCAMTSGVLELVFPEQCGADDFASSAGDGACPPTCLRCHCARPFDVVAPVLLVDVTTRLADWAEPCPAVILSAPADVLHVPRPAAA
ncbi:MAG: hypothetical protein ABIT71_13175 [Vicinamibacteraceae bacterium]